MRPEDPFTGEPAQEWHHCTGRGPDGEYLDPELVVPLTERQHGLEHQMWRATGIDRASGSTRVIRTQRLACLLLRLGHEKGTVTVPTSFLLGIGNLLLEILGWFQ